MTVNAAELFVELAPLLDSPKAQGAGDSYRLWSYCPTHPDGAKSGRGGSGLAGRSLSLSRVHGLECKAGPSSGCSFKEIVKALYARADKKNPGARGKDEVGEKRSQARQGGALGPEWAMVEEYEYRDAAGALVAIKGRFHKPDADAEKGYEKTFRWRLPEGEYRNGISSRYKLTEMPLWGAELLASIPSGTRVWFAEGEKATQAIRARNEIAVCGGWGASQRDYGATLSVLAGFDVALWPDNDVAGREYMSAVRQALKSIAKSVFTVQAPVPPKGDAVEYFGAAGTIEALLANVITKTTTDVLDHDHFIVRVPTDEGPVAFEFAEMMRSQGALDCELSVSHMNPAAEPEPYTTRINLLSSSAREGLQRQLGNQFGKNIGWTTIVSAAFARARSGYMEAERGIHVAELAEHDTPTWTVDTILPEAQETIFFADGSSGKTYLAYSLGLSVALGGSWCGRPVKQGGVVIVDYETDGGESRFRLRRLIEGLNLDPLTLQYAPIWYWPGMGIPLPDQADALARFVKKKGAILTIIDSGADACGGEPERAASALNYFNALSKLRTTTLTICHVNRSESPTSTMRPFGSSFWHNRARRTWYIKREQEEDSDSIDVALICRKANSGRKPYPLAYRIDFFGDSGPVRIVPQDFRQVDAFESEHSVADRAEKYLIAAGTPLTIKAIMERFDGDVKESAVKSALDRGKGQRFVQIAPGPGKPALWAVLAS